MIAPEPFFEPRGTPFSEFHRIRALTELGHQVDLVTYPFGRDVAMPGLRVFRALRPPFVRRVGVGPSFAKIPLDALLALAVVRRAFSGRYDAIHSHEEGGLIGIIVAAVLRIPHLYDMHSSLPQQLTNFDFTRSRLLRRLFAVVERAMIRRSRVVIVVCPSLEETVRAVDPDARAVLIENAPGSADDPATSEQAKALRQHFGLSSSTPVVLYAGTFEAYQGLDVLFEAMSYVRTSRPDARLLLAGGKPDQVERAQAVALKIYQYLRSGKPIVATRLLTHTQVLSDRTAILTGTSARELAVGIVAALQDPARAAAIAHAARQLAETKYSYAAYLERTRQACDALFSSPAAESTTSMSGVAP
jgi:glycosyltransferase involved in cell wall biosynthesis